jgi:hypothetical protein
MTPTSLIVLADRGGLKAYRVLEVPAHGPSLQLVEALEMTDAKQFVDKLSGQVAAVPMMVPSNGRANGAHVRASGDWPQLEAEAERRICRQLAQQIVVIVQKANVEAWSLAAPSSIHAILVDHLPPEIRERIVEHVESDLVRIPAAKLAAHFRSLQPM